MNTAIRTSLTLLALLSALACLPASASMQNELNSMFDGMSNVTNPQAFKTDSRGGFAFGGVTVRTPVVNQSVASWVPPSMKGGCGGIDINGGSFSFISGQQIVNTLQKVASNAQGYAFQLALDAVYPQAANWINAFQKKLQKLNQYLGNSCQLAQGIVNDTKTAVWGKKRSQSQSTASITGAATGFWGAISSNWGPSDEESNPATSGMFKDQRGNLTYRGLMDTNAIRAFQDGDQDMAEYIQSVTGATVVPFKLQNPKDSQYANMSGKIGGKVDTIQHIAPTMSLTDFAFGPANGNPQVIRCGTSTDDVKYCAQPTVQTDSTFKPLSKMIEDAFLGSNGTIGILDKQRIGQQQLSNQENAIMVSLPSFQGSLITRLNMKDPGAAKVFAVKIAKSAAIDMAYNLMKRAIKIDINSVNSLSDVPGSDDEVKRLKERLVQLSKEHAHIKANRIGTDSQLLQEVKTIMQMTQPTEFVNRGMGL